MHNQSFEDSYTWLKIIIKEIIFYFLLLFLPLDFYLMSIFFGFNCLLITFSNFDFIYLVIDFDIVIDVLKPPK